MINPSCSQPDCTVAVTGKCLLSHTPIQSCPHVTDSSESEHAPEERSAAAPLATKPLHHANELGLQQAATLMSARYGHLIGLLGATATGKTCLLSSMYLLASCGELRPQFLFAGSATLPGFENRVRLLRKWTGSGLPQQIVDHTVLTDSRQPGILHLSLLQTSPLRGIRDLYFTDLPGEWTTDLISRADTAERLLFLQRADALILALPAPQLLSPESRNSQTLAGRMLLQRLRDTIGVRYDIPVVLAITRCDLTGSVEPTPIYELLEVGRQLGFLSISHLPVASFSSRPDTPSGMGVAALLETLLSQQQVVTLTPGMSRQDPRMIGRYRFAKDAPK